MILTPKQRLVFRLHRKDGVPQKEIAQRLGVTPVAVCRMIARAENRLRSFAGACPSGKCELTEIVEAALN
jgi:RNA polymerase sigma factor (sigma-70 family)